MRGTVTVLALEFMIYSRNIVAEAQNERKKNQGYIRSMDQVFLWNSGRVFYVLDDEYTPYYIVYAKDTKDATEKFLKAFNMTLEDYVKKLYEIEDWEFWDLCVIDSKDAPLSYIKEMFEDSDIPEDRVWLEIAKEIEYSYEDEGHACGSPFSTLICNVAKKLGYNYKYWDEEKDPLDELNDDKFDTDPFDVDWGDDIDEAFNFVDVKGCDRFSNACRKETKKLQNTINKATNATAEFDKKHPILSKQTKDSPAHQILDQRLSNIKEDYDTSTEEGKLKDMLQIITDTYGYNRIQAIVSEFGYDLDDHDIHAFEKGDIDWQQALKAFDA